MIYFFHMKLFLFLWVMSIQIFSVTLNVNVTRVIDGDTLYVNDEQGQRHKVRLWGIDAPELTQRDGAQSGRFLGVLVGGKSVKIKVVDTDRYGRWIAKVYDENNLYLNEEMVRLGLAWVYDFYVQDQQPSWNYYQDLAKAKKIGVWRRRSPIPPWDYRQKKSK